MANPGEWIKFAELCRRVPGKSASTLRRYYKKDGLISYRQAKAGGVIEFNWKTVSRELAALETAGLNANVVPADIEGPPDFAEQWAEVRTLVHAIARKMGIQPEGEVFSGEQRRVV